MAKLFDGANRYIVFMQVLALLAGVCFTSPQPEKGPRLLTRSNPAVSKQWARAKEGPSVNLNPVYTFRNGVR